MSTGDLNGNLQRLLRELKAIKYPTDVDEVGLRLGDPVAFLPLLNFALLKFSRHVARHILRNGFELAGKTDHRFVESSFRLFRELLNVRTVLSPAQFFEHGFAERKVLLICDVIAVCKKVHNEEVRQERLAALKANRQEHVSERLSAPRRTSPLVKVVRGDEQEVHQVLAPQHLPNASDGAQSVYKTRKVMAVSKSPSPLPSKSGVSAKEAPSRQHGLHDIQSSFRKPGGQHEAGGLELTFRPAGPSNISHAAPQRQAAGSRGPAAAPAPPPIHTWFLNPAFDEEEQGGVDLGAALGTAGRPDSSAWWRPSPSAPEPGSAPFWQQNNFSNTSAAGAGAAASNNTAAGSSSAAADSTQPTRYGAQQKALPGAAAWQGRWQHTAAPAAAPCRAPQVQPPPQWGPQGDQASRQPQRRTASSSPQNGGGAVAAPAAQPAASGSSADVNSRRFVERELDEWSFSRFFGPGRVPQHRHNDDNDDTSEEPDSNSQQLGSLGEGDVAKTDGDRDEEHIDYDDLRRGGLAPDQNRRSSQGRQSSPGHSVPTQHAAFPEHSRSGPDAHSPRARRRPHDAAEEPPAAADDRGAVAATDGSHGLNVVPVDWPAQMARLERETQEQLQQLRNKLTAAEEELEKTKVEARQSRDALQARVTVLEGRVRFLECELEMCVKRHPGTEATTQPHSPVERASPPPASSPPRRQPNLAWQAPTRPHSAGSPFQASDPPRPAPAPPPPAAAAARQPDGRAVTAQAVGTLGDTIRQDQPPPSARVQGFVSTTTGAAAGGWAARPHDTRPAGAEAGVLGTRSVRDSLSSSTVFSANPTLPSSTRPVTAYGAAPPAPSVGAVVVPQRRDPVLTAAPAAAAVSHAPQPVAAGQYPSARPPMQLAFSPMPQPTFSFQPSSLMRQVACAAAQPAAHQAPSSAASFAIPAASHVPAPGTRVFSSNLDTAAANGGNLLAGSAALGHAGAYVTSVASYPLRSSIDTTQAYVGGAAQPGAPTAAPGASNSSTAAAVSGWKPPDRAGARIHGGGSILDSLSAGTAAPTHLPPPQTQPMTWPATAHAASGLAPSHIEAPDGGRPTGLDRPHASYLSNSGVLPGGTAPGHAAPPSASTSGLVQAGGDLNAGSGRVGGASGSFRSTDDLINSLYLRYTEAHDFLQTIRKR